MPPPPSHYFRRRLRRALDRVLRRLDLSRVVDRGIDRWRKGRFRRERRRQAREREAQDRRAQRAAQKGPAPAWIEDFNHHLRAAGRFGARHWLWVAVPLLVAAGVAGARPAWARLRQWRGDHLVGQARTALAQGDWKLAYERSGAALMLRDTDREAAWVFFKAMRAMGNPKALELGYWLFAWPELPKDRRQEILQLFAERAPEAAFFGALNSLPTEDREAAPNRALFVGALIRRGDLPQAAAVLEQATDVGSHPSLQVEFIRLLCARQEPGDIDGARRRFRELQKSGPATAALEALRLLHAVPAGTLPRPDQGFPVLEAWLASLREATTRDRLIAADQQLAQGVAPEIVISDVVAELGRDDPGETAAWLNRQGRHEQAIALATPAASDQTAAFTALVEAQVALRLRDSARRTLAAPPPGLHPVDLSLLHLRLASLGGEDEIREAWASVLRAAEDDPDDNRAYSLVTLAESTNRPVERDRALSIALRHRWGTHPLYSKIEPLLATLVSTERTWEILEICRNIARYEPDNAPLQNNVLYLECVTGKRSPAEAIPPLERLFRDHPTPDFALSLAFAFLANHQPDRALALVDPLRTDPGNQSFLRHAIAGTALHRLNRPTEAQFHLDRVPWSSRLLLPEEIAAFKTILAAPADAALTTAVP
ncbi:MAG: hypothetical protein ACKV19_25925 [Verrucomicrobiales bacterium]